MAKPVFNCRIEEVPIIGNFVYSSFGRDTSAFAPYTDYDAPFPANFLSALNGVRAAALPVVLNNQMKQVTFNLLTDMYGVRAKVNDAEIYFFNAGSTLNVSPKDMGQSAVRRAVNRGDVEALVTAMIGMNQLIASNSNALIAKGFTLIKQNALVTTAGNLFRDNNIQNTLYEQKIDLAVTNMVLYNNFWSTYVGPVCLTGKLIFKVTNKSKAKEYTISALKGRIRADEKETWVFGKVTDVNNATISRAKVKLIPVDGGRTKTGYTDKGGNFKITGMRATDYNMVVTFGTMVKIIAITVVTRVHLEQNVQLS